LEGAVHFFRAVDFVKATISECGAGIEALVLQLASIGLGVRTQGQEGQQESLIAGLLALYYQSLV